MKVFFTLVILLGCLYGKGSACCPNEKDFCESGWIVHSEEEFSELVNLKLEEFLPQVGEDLILDHAEYYVSDYSHDAYLIISIVIWDRLSTDRDEMWGDVAIASAGSLTENCIVEIRWYDAISKKKHIAYNSNYACCLTTKVPLAYNTIF